MDNPHKHSDSMTPTRLRDGSPVRTIDDLMEARRPGNSEEDEAAARHAMKHYFQFALIFVAVVLGMVLLGMTPLGQWLMSVGLLPSGDSPF